MATEAGEVGRKVGEYIIKNKEIIGLFDTFCMGMINGVFPQQAMINIGMPIESLLNLRYWSKWRKYRQN